MNDGGISFSWQNKKSVYPNLFINIRVRRSNNVEHESATRGVIFRFPLGSKNGYIV